MKPFSNTLLHTINIQLLLTTLVCFIVLLFIAGCSTTTVDLKSAKPESKQVVTVAPTPKEEAEAKLVKSGLQYFESGDFKQSREVFSKVQKQHANNAVSAYFLGLIELQEGNSKATIKLWNKYMRLDPVGARENDIQERLALIETEVLDKEVEALLQNESVQGEQAPEPNSVAVFDFAYWGDKKYNVLAKGMTALIITDLSKVPGLKVLERQKLQKLMGEMKLSKTQLVDGNTKIRAGRLMKAEKLMLGDLTVE